MLLSWSFANWNNNSDLRQQYGEAYFNRPQRFVVNYSWDLPFGNHTGVLGALTKGWNVSGVTIVQAGQPLTFTDAKGGSIYGVFGANSINPTNFGGATFGANNYSRAQICPGVTYGDIASTGNIEQRLGGASGGTGFWNTSAFSTSLPTSACSLPVIGNGTDYGNSGVGIARGPSQANYDLSISKTTRVGGIHENGSLIFRAEFFNALNHPQFNNPGTATSTPATFGIITSTSVAPRLIQFALKYVF